MTEAAFTGVTPLQLVGASSALPSDSPKDRAAKKTRLKAKQPTKKKKTKKPKKPNSDTGGKSPAASCLFPCVCAGLAAAATVAAAAVLR